jgi:hypothetical protein
MKRSKITWREIFAVLIGVAALAGLGVMWYQEGFVVLENAAAGPSVIVTEFNAHILPGIQKYSMAIGGILLAISVAYILLGADDDIETSLTEQELKK